MVIITLVGIIYSISILTLVITYFVYPIIIDKILPTNEKDIRDTVGKLYIIIPAYNEENVLEKKVLNSIKFGCENCSVVIVSDGSTDRTNAIGEKLSTTYEKVLFYINTMRGGKNICLNLAFEKISPDKNDILIFTDCNTFFDENSINEIVRSLKDGAALVGGSMVYEKMATGSAKSEGLYWKYEEWLRKKESLKGRLIVCNGGLFGMWSNRFEELKAFVPNDFEAPLRLSGSNLYVAFNEKALGIESAINDPSEEYRRKERMANRQMNCIKTLWKRINTGTKIQVLFHKVIRWYGLHIFLISTLLLLLIKLSAGNIFVDLLLLMHVLIFSLIFLSWINLYIDIDKKILPKILHAVKVHIYGARGASKALSGNKTSIWEKASTNR
ncbi:glycosyltransferase family 2 protein [soil metagenome]